MPITTYPQQIQQSQGSLLGQAQVTTSQGSISTEIALTGLAVTVTVPAGRVLRAIVHLRMSSTTNNDVMQVNIKDELGNYLQQSATVESNAGRNNTQTVVAVFSPTAGTHTYSATCALTAGVGPITTSQSTTFPAFITVEDITGFQNPYGGQAVPVGVLAQASVTATQGSITAAVDLTGLAVTVTVPAGRVLRISGFTTFTNTTAGDGVLLFINEGGTVLQTSYNMGPTANQAFVVPIEVILSPSAGTHTYKLRAQTEVGGTATLQAGTGSPGPAYILVEDITSTPAPANTSPSSTLAYQQVITTVGSVTSEIDYISLTVTVPAGRRLKFTVRAIATSTVAGDVAALAVKEGTTYIQDCNVRIGAASVYETLNDSVIITPSAGTHTYLARIRRASGTGTLSYYADGNGQVGFLLIEDVTGVAIPPGSYSSMPPQDATASANTEGTSGALSRADHLHRGGIAPVTSSTRPSSPYNEQFIGETDTGLLKFWNGSNWVTQTNMKMFGAGAAISGSGAPAIDTGTLPFKIQAGTNVLTTDGTGNATISFPVAFPGGVFCVMILNGDDGNSPNQTFGMSSCSNSQFVVKIRAASTAASLNSTLTRVNWLAIGW